MTSIYSVVNYTDTQPGLTEPSLHLVTSNVTFKTPDLPVIQTIACSGLVPRLLDSDSVVKETVASDYATNCQSTCGTDSYNNVSMESVAKETGSSVAIATYSLGQGRVCLCEPHIEAAYADIEHFFPNLKHGTCIGKLEKSVFKRDYVVRKIFTSLGLE